MKKKINRLYFVFSNNRDKQKDNTKYYYWEPYIAAYQMESDEWKIELHVEDW